MSLILTFLSKNNTMKHFLLLLFLTTVSLCLQADDRESKTIRLMTYNIRNGIGTDEKQDLSRVNAVVNRLRPDVLAVEEVDSVTRRCQGHYTLGQMAEATGLHPTYAPAILFDGGKYGIGILSREQPITVKRVPLPGREESRMLLEVEFDRFVFFATHLSLTEADQLTSVDIINREAAQWHKPVFLAGDMNSTPASAVQLKLAKTFRTLSDTTRSTNEDGCIDYIYSYQGHGHKGKAKVTGRAVYPEHVASDHCPVYVDVRLKH